MTGQPARLVRPDRLVVTVSDARGRPIADGGLARWLSRAAVPVRARGSVTVALVSDPVVRRLNRTYRGLDAVTDVLSFPTDDLAGASLGDIVIARGVARRQARRLGHAERLEWRVLALHGLLHLLGYDHDVDRGQMAKLEDRLRVRAGLPSGLIGRTRPVEPRT